MSNTFFQGGEKICRGAWPPGYGPDHLLCGRPPPLACAIRGHAAAFADNVALVVSQ